MMKALRRSLKGDPKPHHHHHLSITPKSAIAILPPKKVIKALYDYHPEPGNNQELAFSKGDFFHVISREDDLDWYEACNPLIPTARGLVPVSFFEVISKQQRDSSGSIDFGTKKEPHDSGFADRATSSGSEFGSGSSKSYQSHPAFPRMSMMGKAGGAMVYGVVMYDFQAERPDELDAKSGEAIIVIAQSNPEWFVAKPIGRLGGPGLIPVSFVELRDMQSGQIVTDPLEAVRRAGVPKVEEWKKMTAEYKNSSITLGKIEANSMQSVTSGVERMSVRQSADHMSHMSQNGMGYHNRNASKASVAPSTRHQHQPSQSHLPLVAPVVASIPRYCFDNDKYWYIIEVKMEDGRCWELSRYYHDFYDFQINLLTQFEEEAGNRGKPRTLPFMPGPVAHVTDAISDGRRHNLDEYIKKLLSMPPHITRCALVRQLFAPRAGDFEIDPSAFGEDARFSGGSQHSSGQELSPSASRQSSQQQMNGPSERSSHSHSHSQAHSHRSQPSGSLPNGKPPMIRQQSSLTQVSTSSGGALKVKVNFQGDLIAIRVPADISVQQLKEKLRDRLKISEEIAVQYKDEPSGTFADLLTDHDLDTAIQRNPKLTLQVGLA
ncbi:hypothetical protein BDV18DRAFT_33763 [Aspergillus unguis]